MAFSRAMNAPLNAARGLLDKITGAKNGGNGGPPDDPPGGGGGGPGVKITSSFDAGRRTAAAGKPSAGGVGGGNALADLLRQNRAQVPQKNPILAKGKSK